MSEPRSSDLQVVTVGQPEQTLDQAMQLLALISVHRIGNVRSGVPWVSGGIWPFFNPQGLDTGGSP